MGIGDEPINGLKQNNLDIAKAKMERIMRLEDQIIDMIY